MRKIKTITCTVAVLIVALLALPAAAQVKSYEDLKFPKLPDFKIDKPEVYTLSNGMTVFLLEDHELPLINVSARIRTGSNYEPADKTGLGGIFGQVQREGGTTSMSGDEIDDFLEARAASVETSVGGDTGFASMNCLKEDFDQVFALFNDVLRNPAFSEDKIELAKVQANTGIARRNDNVGGIVSREFNRLIRGESSPLSRLTEYATVAGIGREDLLAWHKKFYHPNNVYLGIVGDFDSASMKKKIEQTFGNWAKGPAFSEGDVPYDRNPKPGVYFVEKSDVTQANIRMGHLGIKRQNPDYYAVQVMNEVLSGGFSGRLMQNIRSKKGLAYGVGGGVGADYMREGVTGIGMSTKSSTMAESVDALKQEIRGIIDTPPTDEEIKQAKETILNSFIFNYTSKNQILGQQMLYAFYGMPADYLENYKSNIEKVTRENVAEVAKKYVHPDKMVMLVVGKSEEFDKPMSSFGEFKEIDITIPEPPDTTAKVARNQGSLEAGSKLFARAAQTLVGSGKPKLKTMKLKATRTLKIQGQSMALGQEVSISLPDKINLTMTTPMGNQNVVINGDEGYVMMGGQKQPLPAAQIEESVKDMDRELLFLANSLGDPDLEALAAGSDEVEGTKCDVVAVTFRGSESRLCVAADGKVLKQTFRGKHPFQRTPGQIELTFSDYRDVDGRMIPHKQVMKFEGEELSNTVMESISINPDLEGSLFEIAEAGS